MLQQDEIFDGLINLERKIGELYNVYAGIYSNKVFWEGIAKEEEAHAQIVIKLKEQVVNDKLKYNFNRFSIVPVNNLIEDLGEKISDAKAGKTKLIEALAIAKNIESSLLERRFYEVIEEDSEGIKKVFRAMDEGIAIHVQKVERELARNKQ